MVRPVIASFVPAAGRTSRDFQSQRKALRFQRILLAQRVHINRSSGAVVAQSRRSRGSVGDSMTQGATHRWRIHANSI
jgi:hypothetical protein